jgi:2-hydroxychromene-2-carboxylate isomerase
MPVNAIHAMRLHFIADQSGPVLEAAWMDAVFHAYFGDGRDISDDAVLAALCQQVGVKDGPEACNHESIKRLLITNTKEAYDAGAPGVPFFVLEGDDGTTDVFWGNDRLEWIEARIALHDPSST